MKRDGFKDKIIIFKNERLEWILIWMDKIGDIKYFI